MKENKYDDPIFFAEYSKMNRSILGLNGAGEWHEFKKLLPNLTGKNVLDLGCGFGWHCSYAAKVVGIDLSYNMLNEAKKRHSAPNITYLQCAIEDYAYPANQFDVVLSSLALHYVPFFDEICKKIWHCLHDDGDFIFSVEHPIFTAYGNQDWIYNAQHKPEYWPVDHYFEEGKRTAIFLGKSVTKYHKTLTTYCNGLLQNGFIITHLVEPMPPKEMMDFPGMKNELRRPMMLLIAAKKQIK